MNKLTSKGNLKTKTQTNKILLEKRVNQVYQYWKKQEFPYYPRDKKYRREQFKKFMKTNDRNSLDFSIVFLHLITWGYLWRGRILGTHLKLDVIISNRHMNVLTIKQFLKMQLEKDYLEYSLKKNQ